MKICPPEYWIWLQTALGAGARTDEILDYFGTPEALYTAGSDEWRLSGLFTEKKIASLKRTTPSETWAVLNECKKCGYGIITPDSNKYPQRLRSLTDMPLALYTIGDDTVLLDELSFGIVGTREASTYGKDVAQKISYRLAQAGATIFSGGALGIDSEAHAGAMLAKGRTCAFLGCGLSYDYLRENAALRRAITRYGAVISEFQPFHAPSRITFPTRNRLISGVSLGIIVIEAGKKSGSLITADKALNQGKDVFAVPGDIVRSSFDGCNHLLQNGAKPVLSAFDVLCEYESTYGHLIDMQVASEPLSTLQYVDYRKGKSAKPKPTVAVTTETADVKPAAPIVKKELGDDVSPEAKQIYNVLSAEPMHIDDIVRATQLRMNIVLSSMTELELIGVVELTSGKNYKLI